MRKKGLLGVFVVGVLAIVGFTLVKQWGEGAVVVLGPPTGAVRVTIDGRDMGTVQAGAWRRYAVRLGRHEVRIEGVRARVEPAKAPGRSPRNARDRAARTTEPAPEPVPEAPLQKVTHEVTLDGDFAHLGVPALKEQCFTELELTLKPDGTRTPKVLSRTKAAAPWPIPVGDLLSETALPRSVGEERRYTVLATIACDAMTSDATVLASLGHAMAAPPTPEPPPSTEPAAGGLTAAEVDAPPAAPESATPGSAQDAGSVAAPAEPEPPHAQPAEEKPPEPPHALPPPTEEKPPEPPPTEPGKPPEPQAPQAEKPAEPPAPVEAPAADAG